MDVSETVTLFDGSYLIYLLLIETTWAPQSEALSAEVVVLSEAIHHFIDMEDI